MKNIISLGLIITILLVIVNCGGKDNPSPDPPKPPEPPVVNTITVTPQSTSIPAVGGTQTLTVTTNAADWTVNPDATWLTATKINATSVKIEAGANIGSNRNTTVRFTAGTATTTVNVSQTQVTAIQSDSLALVDLYNSTAGTSWTRKWTLTTPLNQWQGVTIANNRVTELKLSANKLTGALPESFGNLTAMQYCDLSKNSLNEVIDVSINRLTQLYYLDLSENTFTGNFPAINTLTKLLVFDISFNGFTALPAFNSLVALEYLAFSKNNFSAGNLPDNLSALTKLIYLDASFNKFSGNIPSAWSPLTKLKALYLYGNTLEGNIPAYITTFVALESLALDGNNLGGNIPTNLGNLPNLAELWLAKNRLTGVIPNSLLSNSHWTEWQSNVCPQQSGYGFSNGCDGITSAGVQSAKISSRSNEFKSKYKR